ncbi:MAG: type II secretion system minor pseudopilin GspK [Desulfuromonadales bacterium]
MNRMKQERGAVLLLVLVIIALLATLVTEFASSTLVDMRLTESYRDSNQSYYLAKGGVEAARRILADDTNGWDSRDEFWASGVDRYPVGEGWVSIDIEDRDGRLNLNRLVKVLNREERRDNPDPVYIDRFTRLLELVGAPDPPALTDALIDWLDFDDRVVGAGAESNYYLNLQTPYPAKNGALDSVSELTMVRGFDNEVVRLLEPYVTVRSSPRLNLNTASAEVIACWAQEDMTIEIAETIVEFRDNAPLQSLDDLKDVPGYDIGWESALKQNADVGVQSTIFRVRTQGSVGEGASRVEATVQKGSRSSELLTWKVD